MIRYAFFDLDGTLADTSVGIFHGIDYATEHMGLPRVSLKTARAFIGPPLKDSFISFCGLSDDRANEAVKLFRKYYNDRGKYECVAYPGVKEAISELHSHGERLFVATAKPTGFACDIIRYLGLIDLFEEIAGSEPENNRGRKCDVIRYLINRYSIKDLEEVVMVGDRDQDILSASECGIHSIGVSFGFGTAEELEGADIVLNSMKAVAEYLV